MKSKELLQNDILDFIDDYFNKTPDDIIKAEIDDISKLKFSGGTAICYFEKYHKNFLQPENLLSEIEFNDCIRIISQPKRTIRKLKFSDVIQVNNRNNRVYKNNVVTDFNLFKLHKSKVANNLKKEYSHV